MKASEKSSLAADLKAKSDQEVLRLMRQSNKLRNPRRLRRAITSTGKPKAPDWTRQEEALLGKMPDAEVAKRLGRTIVGVGLRRSRLGIPNYGHPVGSFRRWTPEDTALLGTMPDRTQLDAGGGRAAETIQRTGSRPAAWPHRQSRQETPQKAGPAAN